MRLRCRTSTPRAPQTSASMEWRSITNTANRSSSSEISPDMSSVVFHRASAIFLSCGHCRRSRSPGGSRNTGNILASSEAAIRHSGKRARRAGVTGAATGRFVFLALSPFVAKPDLIEIFGCNLLDDETQRDGFAELCGLRANKPFECVGETFESAGVMSYLAGHPGWRDDKVVSRLNEEFPSAEENRPAALRALLEVRHPHRVPARYLAMLDARG
jgi:hypothetical protein